MKKINLLITIILLISINMSAQNQNFDKQWAEIEKFEKQDLPQSASKVVEAVLQEAISKNNIQQVIKALLHKNKYKQTVDNEDISIFKDITALLNKTDNTSDRALLHSIMAELYMDYYNQRKWNIDQLTLLEDIIPEDIREWSSNIFINQAIDNIKLSVMDKKELKTHSTKEFKTIINLGEDSQEFYPTLYDFLMKRAIEITRLVSRNSSQTDLEKVGLTLTRVLIPADQFVKLDVKEEPKGIVFYYYKEYFNYLLDKGMTPTIILTELDKINYISSTFYIYSDTKLISFLQELDTKYANNPVSVEITNKIIESYLQSQNTDYERVYTLSENTIKKYPNYKRINIIKDRISSIEKPLLQTKTNNIYYPSEISIDIQYRNLQALPKYPELLLEKEINGEKKIIKRISIDFTSEKKYITETKSISLGKLEPGKYSIRHDGEKNNNSDFIVSSLSTFTRNNSQKQYEIYVVDRMSGKPIEGVTVKVVQLVSDNTTQTEKVLQNFKTDKNGFVTFANKEQNANTGYYNKYFYLSLGEDKALEKQYIQPDYASDYYSQQNDKDEEINIFIDRTIYRPGQTVYFKAIATVDKQEINTGKKLEVKLINQNDQTIATKTLVTNEFGSIGDSFVLPKQGLLGHYCIRIGSVDCYFRVEEYKRPTFEITFDKIDQTFAFGSEITVKGYAKNYSGISLQNTQISYSIAQSPFFSWRWAGNNKKTIDNGITNTNEDGSFEIKFTPQDEDENANVFQNRINLFSITASATDINGETQSGTYSLPVGNVSMILDIEAPTLFEKTDTTIIHITAKNLEGKDIETSGRYTIYSLNAKDSIQTKVAEGSFKTGFQTELKQKLVTLPSAKYRILVLALDSNNKEVKNEKDIIVFSYQDSKPPIETNEWIVEKNTIFSENKPVEIIFGVSDNDVYVLYQIHTATTISDKQYKIFSTENKTLTIPYKPEYGDEVLLTLTYIKNEKFYHKSFTLKKAKTETDKKLNLKLEVFRDKLRPGQEEQWTLSVKDSKAKPVLAEVLASMYDISIDKLNNPDLWIFNNIQSYDGIPSVYYYNILGNDYSYFKGYNLNIDSSYKDIYKYKFDKFNWFGFGFYSHNGIRLSKSYNMTVMDENSSNKELALPAPTNPASLSYMGGDNFETELSESKPKLTADKPSIDIQQPQIRKNFNETAFFYPQLRTNENGETLISFTVPDSNTSWRFRAFAHNKETKHGQMEQLVISRKELMITPNMPRFVRHGDKTTISTKISNLSEQAISGNAKIEFFDPITNKIMDLKTNSPQTFSIAKDASTYVSWTFDVPQNIDLIGCRIVASNETFSDGEQHVLAVLPKQLLVTETMNIDVVQSGKSTFTFDKLKNNKSKSLNNYRLVFEYANNPAWYAIQSLPTMSNPTNQNAISWFASYYVNTMGTSIMKHYPEINRVITAWKKQGGDKETLISKLQKDEELKSVLLQESPWVLEAKNETEQMKSLSLLFDLNNNTQLIQNAIQKLSELQDNLGGWSWYKGMYPNQSITQYILYGFAKLQLVGSVEYSAEIKEMQIKALQYIDKRISDDFEILKMNNKQWNTISGISTTQLEYLYVRSFYRDIPISEEAHEAERFYTSVVSKNWKSLDLYERSLLVVLLQTNGEKELALNLANTVRERAVTNAQEGMYWPNNRSRVFQTLSAVSTHTFLMDALNQTGASKKEMDAMKQWLIKQKQTQIWESTHANIDAIGALLNYGSDWFSDSNSSYTIKVGKQVLDTNNKELGTGYVKNTWNASEINSSLATIEIERNISQPAYGALYWQYFEDLDKITNHKNDALNINKELFKVSHDNTLQSITENSPLKIGDKVIMRLTVRINNDMEFVQLKDMRAPCFEPIETISKINIKNGAIYYQETKDAATSFFFDHLPKGTYVFEYPVYVNRTGEYANGITTIQSIYAPEFVSHTQGLKVTVK